MPPLTRHKPRKPAGYVRFERSRWRWVKLRISGVYAIVCHTDFGEFVKIGKALDVVGRLCNLQVGCPFPLTIWGVAKGHREDVVHKLLANYNHRGEWFKVCAEVVDFLTREFWYLEEDGALVNFEDRKV